MKKNKINLINFLKRNSILLVVGIFAFLILGPQSAEIKTIFLVIAIESISIALSGFALYVYTKIDFTEDGFHNNPGIILLGVHICVGLSVLGVYIAQFSY